MKNTDDDFDRIRFKDFNIYRYNPASHRINLLDMTATGQEINGL